ncbi:hypothetical protein HWC07_gp076 [Pantoea phage vB_PagM_LIET2]|uniref:Uncharacterized protein n=1 Tax=Pantoea phage vB_PagM_LIET2 TaxID=2508071 RepID=A0A411AW64_9CAUD|nr:hypothetical protein HWC07_gp076 [Pantoea phage vB_PagM_LIET2]QAX92328.1 hypothetical protein LIET2_gp076 [Pantoea phage vB_PagM_LIET2]UJH95975.1 hypothetical protein [Pantoea phage Nafs113]
MMCRRRDTFSMMMVSCGLAAAMMNSCRLFIGWDSVPGKVENHHIPTENPLTPYSIMITVSPVVTRRRTTYNEELTWAC